MKLRILFLREIMDQLKSIRFTMSLVVILVLMLMNGLVYINRYQVDVNDHDYIIRHHEDRMGGETTSIWWVADGILAIKRPLTLMFVSEGGQRNIPNLVGVRVAHPHQSFHPHSSTLRRNYMLPFADPLDWEFIVKVILSLMALILVYDSICGEKEDGTLRLVLSNNISRPKVVIAKFLANWTVLVGSFLIGCVLSLTIIIGSNRVPLSGSDWAGLMLFLALSTVYLSLFLLIGMAVSASVGRAVTSLVICLLIWIAVTFAVPGLARMAGQRLYPIPAPAEVESKTRILIDWQNIWKQYEEHNAGWRWGNREEAQKDDFAMERRALEIDERIFSEVKKLHDDYLRKQFNQRQLIGILSSISPAFLLRSTGRAILGTGFLRNRCFCEQIEDFRPIVKDFIIEEDAKDPESSHIFSPINDRYISNRKLDRSEIPVFTEHPVPSDLRLRHSLVGSAILAIETLLAFLWLLIAFIKYDVR